MRTWRFSTILCQRGYNLSSAISHVIKFFCCGRRCHSLAALSVSAVLTLAMMTCSVVEADSTEMHSDEHKDDSSPSHDDTRCCELLMFILPESISERWRTLSGLHLSCQKLGVAVPSRGFSLEPQKQSNFLEDPQLSICLQIDLSVNPCGLRGPPGYSFSYENQLKFDVM